MSVNDEIGVIISEALLEGNSLEEIVQKLAQPIDAGLVSEAEIAVYIKIWQRSGAPSTHYDALSAWASVNERILKNASKRSFTYQIKYYLSGAAAAIVLLLGAAWLFNLLVFSNYSTTIVTNSGDKANVILPDGSAVKLNAATSLSYTYNRYTQMRLVEFAGEGYFEVAKSKQPFLIQMRNGLTLTVLGTKFNLSAYDQDEVFKAALVEGKIELKNQSNERIIVVPGEVATFNKLTGELAVSKSDVNHEKGWIQNKIYLDNMPLSQLCNILERKFAVEITLDKAVLDSKIHYTGVLQEKSIEEVLMAMKQLSSIKYRIDGNQISITNASQLP